LPPHISSIYKGSNPDFSTFKYQSFNHQLLSITSKIVLVNLAGLLSPVCFFIHQLVFGSCLVVTADFLVTTFFGCSSVVLVSSFTCSFTCSLGCSFTCSFVSVFTSSLLSGLASVLASVFFSTVFFSTGFLAVTLFLGFDSVLGVSDFFSVISHSVGGVVSSLVVFLLSISVILLNFIYSGKAGCFHHFILSCNFFHSAIDFIFSFTPCLDPDVILFLTFPLHHTVAFKTLFLIFLFLSSCFHTNRVAVSGFEKASAMSI